MIKCKECSSSFIARTKRNVFCSRPCQLNFNGRKSNRHRSNKYYSKLGPFLSHLIQLSTYDRRELTKEFLLELYHTQGGLCAITGQPMTHIRGQGKVNTNISIDRINSAIGYTQENVQLVCRIVNIMKQDMTQNELKFWCEKILNQKG